MARGRRTARPSMLRYSDIVLSPRRADGITPVLLNVGGPSYPYNAAGLAQEVPLRDGTDGFPRG